MSAPVSIDLAVSDALLARLRTALGPRVWVSVPENTQPPYTVVGQIKAEPIGGKGSRAAWLTVDIIDWTVATSRAPLAKAMAATYAAIADVTIAGVGIAPFTPLALPGATDDLHDDGVTWSGTQSFRIVGQLAD